MMTKTSSPKYPASIRVTRHSREHTRQQLARPACKQGERGRNQRVHNLTLPKEQVKTLLSTFLASNRGVIIPKAIIMTCLFHLLVKVL